MEKLIYQMFILGTGKYLEPALSKGLGGVIFFTRDIGSREQFKELIKKISAESIIYPFLSIDQEGGRVERTENIHLRYLSPRYAYQKGKDFLTQQTVSIAKELNEYGINLNFAPCADVDTNPNNPIIGERAFSSNCNDVCNGVNIVSEIYRQHGIVPCIKHFPGHGNASKDSHLELPQINLSREEMENIHIYPFKNAIENNIEMIMVAHIHCTCFDRDSIPASLSRNVIGYLRNNLNYKGVVITDDMVMKGVQDFGSVEACIMAINAGVDMFIFRDANEETYMTIEAIVSEISKNDDLKQKVLKSNERIQSLKRKFDLT